MTINLILPESMQQFVDEQVAKQGHPTAEEYLLELLREAQKRAGREELKALIREGLSDNESAPFTKEELDELRQELQDKQSRASS